MTPPPAVWGRGGLEHDNLALTLIISLALTGLEHHNLRCQDLWDDMVGLGLPGSTL